MSGPATRDARRPQGGHADDSAHTCASASLPALSLTVKDAISRLRGPDWAMPSDDADGARSDRSMRTLRSAAGRPAAGDRPRQPGGGTPRPPTTTPSTAPSSATPTSSGGRRAAASREAAPARATLAGRRVLEIGAGAAPVLPLGGRPAARRVVATDLSAGMLRRARGQRPCRLAARVPLVQCDARRAAVRRRQLRRRLFTAYGVVPVRRGHRRGASPRSPACCGPAGGSCSRRRTRSAGRSPTTRGRAGLTRDPVVLRPHALRRAATPTARRPTSSTTAPSATGCARSSPRAWCSSTSSSRSGRRATSTTWGGWSPLRGRCSPARRSS